MKTFSEIRSDVHRLCSDLSAGIIDLQHFQRQASELLRVRAACQDATLWRMTGTGDSRLLGRSSHAGLHADKSPPPSPPLAVHDLRDYIAWFESSGYLTNLSAEASGETRAQALLLHDGDPGSYLHIPTYYNGEVRGVICFSDPTKELPWSGAMRRDVNRLIALITTYVSPLCLCRSNRPFPRPSSEE